VLRIPCPHCGVRDEPEFVFGGPSHIARPEPSVSDEVWADYLYVRENRAGLHYERWLHAYGCGRWFNAVRNTLTHEILETYLMGDPKPALKEGSSLKDGS
jgi:sarcosine oxidase, subunit delta